MASSIISWIKLIINWIKNTTNLPTCEIGELSSTWWRSIVSASEVWRFNLVKIVACSQDSPSVPAILCCHRQSRFYFTFCLVLFKDDAHYTWSQIWLVEMRQKSGLFGWRRNMRKLICKSVALPFCTLTLLYKGCEIQIMTQLHDMKSVKITAPLKSNYDFKQINAIYK